MKKLIEYTPQEIALVCEGMLLRGVSQSKSIWYITDNILDTKDRIAIKEPEGGTGIWFYSHYDTYMNKEDILACELKLHEYFDKPAQKPLTRFELIND